MRKKKYLPKISKSRFDNLLKERKVEDLDLIDAVDNFFIKKRGYVFRKPKAKTKVILLLSGGIDSTVAWAALLDIYNYQVYPLIIDRGLKKRAKRELRAVKNLEKHFSAKYPENYIKPFHLHVNPTPKEVLDLSNEKLLTANDLLNNFNQNNKMVNNQSNVVITRANGISPYLMSFYAVFYADYLKYTKGINIKDIYTGINFSDGFVIPSQSFTSLRTTLLSICGAKAEYDWNFSSVFLEREMGLMLDKKETIKLGKHLKVPFEKTWSCYQHKLFQCGDACATCVDRRNSFKEAGVEDKTIYMFNLWYTIRQRLKKALIKV
jgi:7-cyano-7-deazaguanine synthase